jgi:protein involved in polysaccharide export with SLBB domain
MIFKYFKVLIALSFTFAVAATMYDNASLIEQLKNDKTLQDKVKKEYSQKQVSTQSKDVNKTKIDTNSTFNKFQKTEVNETNETNETKQKRKYTKENYFEQYTPFFFEDQISLVENIEKKQVVVNDKKLERFGVKFFQPTSQIMIPSGAPDNYIVATDDSIKISVYGVDGFETELTVNKEGKIIISNVGAISVRGLEYSQVKKVIKSKLWATYPNSDVIVTIGNMSPFSVSVVGEVKKPGMYTLSALSKVKDALIASGGVSENGTMRNIVVKRNGKVAAVFDLYKLLRDGNDNGDIVLRSGDIIHIPLTKKQVWLSGNVKNPAIYELGKNENLQDLLYFSGGVNSDATQSAKITRSNKGQKELFEAKLDDKFSLADQDKIVIGKIADVLNNEVTLAGNVYRKEAISIVKDETVGSLFAKLIKEYGQEKILMPNSDMNYFLVKRVDVNTLQEVILSGNLANAIKGEKSSDVALKTSDKIYIFNKSMTEDIKFVSVNGEVLRSGKFKYFSGMTLADALKAAGTKKESDLKRVKITSIMADQTMQIKYANSAEGHKIKLNSYDDINVTDIATNNDYPKVKISGAVMREGSFTYGEGMTINDLLNLAGGLKQNALKETFELVRYDVKNQTRQYSTKIMNLNEASISNMILKPFDEVMVRSVTNWDTNKTIAIKGEVKFPGVYTILPGERLSSVIKRAGGFTNEAFVEGSVFTRVDVKKIQEEAFKRQLDNMESTALYMSTQPVGAGESSSDKSQLLKALNEIRARAKETPIVGRLSLNLSLNVDGFLNTTSDVVLKGGDVLAIPSVEDSIAIMGEVMTPTAVTFEKDKNAMDYIARAGGIKQSADEDGIFIIKANGEAKKVAKHFLFGYGSNEIQKGDTIVVPVKINAFSGMQFAKDITSIIYQIAVSAAALKTLGTL